MGLGKQFDSKKIEGLVRERLAQMDISGAIAGSRDRQKVFFIEGPPTMNGTPHAGHLRGRVIKDLWYRYNTLRGRQVEFNAGWDAQGLPVELQAQKELGVEGGRKEITESVGIERLVSACKGIVKKYNESWVRVDGLLGMSLNQDNAYWTYKDEFIEREWQIIRKANEGGILEDDFTVIAYCPGCQTSLSHAEVNQGYKEKKDPSVYYKVELCGNDAQKITKLADAAPKRTYLLVWTTMPFTLVTDALVGVSPDEDYFCIDVKAVRGADKSSCELDERWVVCGKRLGALLPAAESKEESPAGILDYTVLDAGIPGKELEGMAYIHPLLDEIPKLGELAGKNEKYHTVVAESFVDAGTGSGLVHLSPANGEEDIAIAKRRGIPVFNPINDEVVFTGDAGKYSGLAVRDADKTVIRDLAERGALASRPNAGIKHSYPHCWRSGHPIVWLARRGWFYKLDRLGDRAIKASEAVEYFFEQPKNRFLGIVSERHPWCISRERFWGCPLPVWNCADCKNVDWFYSRAEIVSAAAELPDGENFELHTPWIDRVRVKCTKCSGTNTQREQYVLDTWHNSGSAPFSSLDDTQYSKYVPVPFLTEGIDQTRGWAYTLLIENVIMGGGSDAPYRSFLFQGHVLDKDGGKMSKSLGNVIDAEELLVKYPVDLVRFYFVWKSSPIEPLSFGTDEMMSRPYQVLSTLYHLHLYYSQNSSYDGLDESNTVAWAEKSGLLGIAEKWLLSKLQGLISDVTDFNERCKFHEAARAIESFVIDALSQTYIPITRGELWDEDDSKKDRRLAIYAVLREALRTLDILVHPLCPYTSEYMYGEVFGHKESVLLEVWPEPDESLRDETVEGAFDLLREIVSISAAARMKGSLKRRWPLSTAVVCVPKGEAEKIRPLHSMLEAQLNVESCRIVEMSGSEGVNGYTELRGMDVPVGVSVELDRKKVAPRARRELSEYVRTISDMAPDKVCEALSSGGSIPVMIDGKEAGSIAGDEVALEISGSEGYEMARRDGRIVFLSKTRSAEMIARGLTKDLARRLQSLRKERGYNPTDVLDVASIMGLDGEQEAGIDKKELAFLVRVREIDYTGKCAAYKDEDVDGQKIQISVE